MKAALIATLTAALGAVLGSIGYSQYQHWEVSEAQRLRYEANIYSRTVLTVDLMSALKASKPGSVLHNLIITNSGSDDLDNLTVDIHPDIKSGEMSFGFLNALDGESDRPEVRKTEDGYSLNYKLLRKGEGAQLWAITDGLAPPRAASTRKGLRLTTVTFPNDADSFSWVLWAAGGAAGILGLIIGVLLGDVANRSVLRAIGLDPKEVTEMYLAEQRKGKK
ncbi:hypothetical protein OF829_19655 [Sphingomonas sp. LB-2]|uniref:hypothetical protein n=1 Tax=Sphingomonas caeni TaxID=2984949 RepID=UPI0022302D30|nr:hypothetical protein [Sphingomonas caeni]MCW3849459.1 hypothetical protein [Sphingomonas caeni]